MLKKLREMMNVKIRLLRGLLEEAIKNIDAGNSNHTEEELNAIIDDLTKLNRGIKRISKTYACEKILHCSSSTFDTYVKLGIIPPGHKEVGFKELSWSSKANGVVCRGQIFTVEDAKAIYDKHVRNINREITYWDVYVAVNAQYHDYIRMYKQWFPNLTEEQLDEKIIHSAINFWFEDEDAGSGKVWNYFKDI